MKTIGESDLISFSKFGPPYMLIRQTILEWKRQFFPGVFWAKNKPSFGAKWPRGEPSWGHQFGHSIAINALKH